MIRSIPLLTSQQDHNYPRWLMSKIDISSFQIVAVFCWKGRVWRLWHRHSGALFMLIDTPMRLVPLLILSRGLESHGWLLLDYPDTQAWQTKRQGIRMVLTSGAIDSMILIYRSVFRLSPSVDSRRFLYSIDVYTQFGQCTHKCFGRYYDNQNVQFIANKSCAIELLNHLSRWGSAFHSPQRSVTKPP